VLDAVRLPACEHRAEAIQLGAKTSPPGSVGLSELLSSFGNMVFEAMVVRVV
jgi:hypothetical protein